MFEAHAAPRARRAGACAGAKTERACNAPHRVHTHTRMAAAASEAHGIDALRQSFRGAVGAPRAGYGSCAVVGSSGALLTERFGADIDAHDFVIRFNGAPTEAFEPVVVSKTSMSFLNTQAMGEELERRSTARR